LQEQPLAFEERQPAQVRVADRQEIEDEVGDGNLPPRGARIARACRLNAPTEMRVACPWYKPSKNSVDFEPDYYLHESAEWLVFPHELDGLELSEISEGKKDLANILDLFK